MHMDSSHPCLMGGDDMPNLETARRMYAAKTNGATTIGQEHKDFADFLMEETFWDDIQSRECYIYDYAHDDTPTQKDHIEHGEETTKTKIDAKFIISSYNTLDKSQVAYHLMFKPSQKLDFEDGDELYYYETGYKQKFQMKFPIGLYCDIPDDKGVYYRWLIVDWEEANQFVKYLIIPCDYRFQWIQIIDGKKYKRYMWGCIRGQQSYTAGIYRDRVFTSLDNVDKFMLPLNDITESFGYNNHLGNTQRLVVSAKVPHPNTWEVSKIENTKPFGVLSITVKQVPFNDDTDLIEYDENGNITDMWADYYSADKSIPVESDPEPRPTTYIGCVIKSSAPTIKVGGSYRTFTASYYDADGNDVSEECAAYTHEWRFFIEDEYGERIDSILTVKQGSDPNVIKVKFPAKNEYIGKRLFIDLYTNAYIYGETETPVSIIG